MLDEKSIDIASQIAKSSDRILMCLVSCQDPVDGIMREYNNTDNKDVFVAALAATLLMRHRQWQAHS